MKKIFLFIIVLLATPSFLQARIGEESYKLGKSDIDTTEVTFISDIIKVQEDVTSRNNLFQHFDQVWSRRSYFNFAFNNSALTPRDNVPFGDVAGHNLEEGKSDWGAAFQVGRNYRLHKKPIANIMQFCIDYTGIDIVVGHHAIQKNGRNVYDSQFRETENPGAMNEKNYYYTPWGLEKYEGSFGMTLGPSVMIAPFTHTPLHALHYLKLHVYYHIGYQASAVYMLNKAEADMNSDQASEGYKAMKDNIFLDWGHGLLTSYGVSLSWKSIGVGFEHRVAKNKYTTLVPSVFVSDKYDFSTTSDLIYLSIRMGR